MKEAFVIGDEVRINLHYTVERVAATRSPLRSNVE